MHSLNRSRKRSYLQEISRFRKQMVNYIPVFPVDSIPVFVLTVAIVKLPDVLVRQLNSATRIFSDHVSHDLVGLGNHVVYIDAKLM